MTDDSSKSPANAALQAALLEAKDRSKPSGNVGLLAALLEGKPPSAPPKPSPFLGAADVYVNYAEAASRLMRYARMTIEALEDYKKRGIEHFETPPVDQSAESLMKLLTMVNRKMDVDYLKSEKEYADGLVYGQSTISAWSALEVFASDVLIAVLKVDSSRLTLIPSKIKVAVAEFLAMDHDGRVEHVVELVKLESKLSPGVGAFEPTFDAFKLGGAVEDLTRREILEFAAVRNCLAHRKGIVDEKFVKACGTTKLKAGDPIVLTSKHTARYFFAGLQYAATVLDRIKALYEPASEFKTSAGAYLDELKKLQA